MRTILIGLFSLAAILVIYLVYSFMSQTPAIDIDRSADFNDIIADSNIGDLSGQIAQVGNVGIGGLKKTRFQHRDKNGEVDREFGFELLLHRLKDVLEVEKPYMNTYQPDFKCYITADKGTVQLESAVGKFTPKDATFTANVVIHVVPQGSSSVEESFVYLDDIAFLSERSQFATNGPIKFVSNTGQLLGAGLELVYNEQLDRLEFFRIVHLHNLRFEISESDLLSAPTPRDTAVSADPAGTPPSPPNANIDSADETSGVGQAEQSDEPTVADDSQEAKAPPTASAQEVSQAGGQYYSCVFSKNVLIDTPKQLIFADDEVSISGIFWPKTSRSQSTKAKPAAARDVKPTGDGLLEPGEPNALGEQRVNVVVTCDNGLTVTPMGSSAAEAGFRQSGLQEPAPTGDRPKNFDDATDRTTFTARKIDYDVSTGDAAATGPLELIFHTNDVMGNGPADGSDSSAERRGADDVQQKTVPVRIVAQRKAEFSSASNQIIFDGDCLCTMLRQDPNFQEKYLLASDHLTVDLPADTNDRATGWAGDIEHLTASGGVVRLVTVRIAANEVLGGIELKCRRFDYDREKQLFSATGPGAVIVNNSGVPEPNEQVPGFSLKRPGWAIIENFDTLQYFVDANRFIADAESKRIAINGFPIMKGQYNQHVKATAGHIEANLTQTVDARTEISTLTASGGITYEDGDNEFAGSRLFYDHDKSVVKIWGDESQPCYFNGALVDGIEIDLQTGKVNARMPVPGALQIER